MQYNRVYWKTEKANPEYNKVHTEAGTQYTFDTPKDTQLALF